MEIDLRIHDDLGANVLEARKNGIDPLNGFMAQVFLGYESQGRTPFTPEDIQNFIFLLATHRKFEPFAIIIIDLFGTTTFTDLSFVKTNDLEIPIPEKKNGKETIAYQPKKHTRLKKPKLSHQAKKELEKNRKNQRKEKRKTT